MQLQKLFNTISKVVLVLAVSCPHHGIAAGLSFGVKAIVINYEAKTVKVIIDAPQRYDTIRIGFDIDKNRISLLREGISVTYDLNGKTITASAGREAYIQNCRLISAFLNNSDFLIYHALFNTLTYLVDDIRANSKHSRAIIRPNYDINSCHRASIIYKDPIRFNGLLLSIAPTLTTAGSNLNTSKFTQYPLSYVSDWGRTNVMSCQDFFICFRHAKSLKLRENEWVCRDAKL